MSNPEISRNVAAEPAHEIGAMAMMLYSTPRRIDRVEAIAVMPGLGEHWRVADAVEPWNEGLGEHLLITGVNPNEETFMEPTLENLSKPPINLKRFDNVHPQPTARHTRHQAEWLTGKVDELDVESMALYVSPYHLLRAYATVLKTREKTGAPRIPIIPMPVAISPDMIIPETEQNETMVSSDAWGMVPGEINRITAYQEKGDVATRQELQDYLSWMWQQPILAK